MNALRLFFGFVLLAMSQNTGTFDGNVILGRPTDHSITASILTSRDLEGFIEYGVDSGVYPAKTGAVALTSGKPVEIVVDGLKPGTRYYYRLRYRQPGDLNYAALTEGTFHTQRPPGASFTFGVQGDSHPERLNRMYDPELYSRTLELVRRDRPDFYVMLGDDFNLDQLYNRDALSTETVGRLYANQRRFLGPMAASTALFLVNGNHEQAAAYLLNGKPNSPPVLAGVARNLFFPNPSPDAFYSGDKERVEFVGLRRDYYAWTWGDALFVTIDPYWHSPVQVDSGIGGGGGGERKGAGDRGRARDWWGITMGDAQYRWFKETLEKSKARFKFVFTHHVLGTGRGGVELADLYEWGGRNRSGEWEFDKRRPGWEMPIHQLMVKNGVSILFQGHDHLFAHQQKDGVTYQECPNPADQGYTTYNREAYLSGDSLPNSGYLRVSVLPQAVRVEYVRSYLAKDEKPGQKHGQVAFSYTVPAGNRR